MVNFKLKIFNNTTSKDYIHNFNNQIKCVKDAILTLEEAIKLMEKGCISEMGDKCKIVVELEKEAKEYQDNMEKTLQKGSFLGPSEAKYGEISSLIAEIGLKAKSISDLLADLNKEKIPNDIINDFVRLIETDENITREIYLTMKKIEDIDDEKLNRFSKKIVKKKNEVIDLSESILVRYHKETEGDNSSKAFESIISILKKIPEDAENLIMIINR